MLPYIVAGLTVTLLAASAAWFWKQCFGNPDPAGFRPPLDRMPPDRPADARSATDGAPRDRPTDTPPTGDGPPAADARSATDGAPQDRPADTPPTGDGSPPADARSATDETPPDRPADTPPTGDGAPRDRPADTPPTGDAPPRSNAPPAPGDGAPMANVPPAGDGPPPADTSSAGDGASQDRPDAPLSDDEVPRDRLADAPVSGDGPLPSDAPAPGDETPDEATGPVARLGVRWSWRRHRPSGLQFLRVTVANAGPNAAAVTRIRLRTSPELADRAAPPAGLLEASDDAAAFFGPDAESTRLPRTIEPGAGTEAYFPCRDVADWLYGVAEGDNLDRNECQLAPECVDDAGVTHAAKRKVSYETWLTHGHGPSLQEYLDGRDSQSGDGPD